MANKSNAANRTPRSKSAPGREEIRFDTDAGDRYEVSLADPDLRALLRQEAMRWAYIVRNRERWAVTERSQDRLHEMAAGTLNSLGIDEHCLKRLSRAEVIEVGVHFRTEEEAWEARVFPWEYVLSAGVRHLGSRWRSLVVRHLHRPRARDSGRPIKQALLVTSCPGRLESDFVFEEECALVRAHLLTPVNPVVDDAGQGTAPIPCERLENPTPRELRAAVERLSPDVIHISGVDAHQGAARLHESVDKDGLYMATEDGGQTRVDALELGRLLNAGKEHGPALVFINTYNSGSRMAALAVAEGAGAAVGFQDFIDDQLAESFLANFYQAWHRSEYSATAALNWAWRRLRQQPRSLRGSGVILWNGVTLDRDFDAADYDEVEQSLLAERLQPLPANARVSARDVLRVHCEPPRRINYAILHNDANLFQSFRLTKRTQHLIEGVELEVTLRVGADDFVYRRRVDVDQNPTFLEDDIRVPLTWDYVRNLNETVRSALYVSVRHGDDVLIRDSYRVDLQPVAEWEDSDRHRAWLPSFILPRDPAVAHIVGEARRYLRALNDYGEAGFDGYQCIDPNAVEPCEGVDLQVRALWCALTYECGIGYINPPPGYARRVQRLRTPGEVLKTKLGTCIDLALLLAALLEFVDIYPAIILLRGHAFPAYWRSDEAYDRFAGMERVPRISATNEYGASGRLDAASRHREWMIAGEDSQWAILDCVKRGELVPIETVAIADGGSFAVAAEMGLENLRDLRAFETMVDVILARRRYGVTPLPF